VPYVLLRSVTVIAIIEMARFFAPATVRPRLHWRQQVASLPYTVRLACPRPLLCCGSLLIAGGR